MTSYLNTAQLRDWRTAYAEDSASEPDERSETSESSRRILVVDDDPCVTRGLRLNLCSRFSVATANSGFEALCKLEENGPFAVVVTDLRMPGMDGIALLEHVRRTQPDTIRVMLSGTVDVAASVRAVNRCGIQRLLLKPTDADELERMLDTALVDYEHRRADRAMAFEDPLLEIGTRRAFDQAAQRVFAHSIRHRRPLSVVMIDVDFFKLYNDSCGHLAGDEILRRVARAIRGTLRASDQPFRFGGEEFILILPDTDAQGATVVMERCRAGVYDLAAAHPASGCGRLTISLGAAELMPQEAIGMAQLVDRADQALYRAKHQGRNRWAVWGNDAARATESMPK